MITDLILKEFKKNSKISETTTLVDFIKEVSTFYASNSLMSDEEAIQMRLGNLPLVDLFDLANLIPSATVAKATKSNAKEATPSNDVNPLENVDNNVKAPQVSIDKTKLNPIDVNAIAKFEYGFEKPEKDLHKYNIIRVSSHPELPIMYVKAKKELIQRNFPMFLDIYYSTYPEVLDTLNNETNQKIRKHSPSIVSYDSFVHLNRRAERLNASVKA